MNPWAITSIIPALMNAGLGVLALRGSARKELRMSYAATAFALSWMSLCETGQRVAPSAPVASFITLLGGPAWIFVAPLYLRFVLVVTGRDQTARRTWVQLALYLPALLLLLLFELTDCVYRHEVAQFPEGYGLTRGSAFGCFIAWILALVAISFYLLARLYRCGGYWSRRQAALVTLGTTIGVVFGMTLNILFPALRIPAPRVGSDATMAWAGCLFLAIRKYRLLAPRAERQLTEDLGEASLLRSGSSYVVVDKSRERSAALFARLIDHGREGLWLTKRSPATLRRQRGLAKTEVVAVGFDNSQDAVPPWDLRGLLYVVTSFLAAAAAPGLLIDCSRELALVNGCDAAFDFLQRISRRCASAEGILLVAIDPATLDEGEIQAVSRAIGGEIL